MMSLRLPDVQVEEIKELDDATKKQHSNASSLVLLVLTISLLKSLLFFLLLYVVCCLQVEGICYGLLMLPPVYMAEMKLCSVSNKIEWLLSDGKVQGQMKTVFEKTAKNVKEDFAVCVCVCVCVQWMCRSRTVVVQRTPRDMPVSYVHYTAQPSHEQDVRSAEGLVQ